MNNRGTKEWWENELAEAHRKMDAARGKATVRKWNGRAMECRMALRDMERRERGETLTCTHDGKC